VLVPLVFGLGTPLATMVGTAIGARPLRPAGLRLIIAIGGGWLALHLMPGNIAGVFVALGLALIIFGTMNALAIALGAWFGRGAGKAAPLSPQPVATLSE
jgi:hypothetical protein